MVDKVNKENYYLYSCYSKGTPLREIKTKIGGREIKILVLVGCLGCLGLAIYCFILFISNPGVL